MIHSYTQKDWVGPAVVDGILEDIRIGLEVNHPKFNQRRVAAVKYLGELYNYRVIESSIIFKVGIFGNLDSLLFIREIISLYRISVHTIALTEFCKFPFLVDGFLLWIFTVKMIL